MLSQENLKTALQLASEINLLINDEIGASLDKGNLIKDGANKSRDRLAKLAKSADGELLKLEEKYREQSGIQKLRIKSNNVNGYFIEVSKSHTNKVPKSFERRQTLVNSERYITAELLDFEKEVLTAKEKLERVERELFKELVSKVESNSQVFQAIAAFLGNVDVYQSLASIALTENFVAPTVSEKNIGIELKAAFHPLIKTKIGEKFIPHNLNLSSQVPFGLITGPNMAGKTTVMREVAIIQFLAQIGSFVPAEEAKVGACDFLFSRLGASDDIQSGQSTFMVEMNETAEIIRHATPRSLIILDEVGRGTSTYDGLSIAWAVAEHLMNKTKALTLFATHYHELIDVVEKNSFGKNLTVKTQTHNSEVHFLYELIESPATQSFGLYVAKLAGIPQHILKRAGVILSDLELKHAEASSCAKNKKDVVPASYQLSFLETYPDGKLVTTPVIPDHLRRLQDDLANIDLMTTTPIQALIKLKEIQDNLLH